MRKAGLALAANGHQAPGDGDVHALGFESHPGRFAMLRHNLREGMGRLVVVGIGLLSKGLDLLQLFLAQRKKVALKL